MNYDDPDKVPAIWEVGDVILGLYEVRDVFTGGGMGLVYRVYHRNWNMDLAVKSPRPEYFQSQDQIENFEREAETWVNLGLHPHIVSCYYVRRLGGIPRIFAEFVEGGSLSEWIRNGKLHEGNDEEKISRILDVAIQFAWGLHYAHEKGLVHRDVKPGNVLMTPDGTAKVTDFGLAAARQLSGEATTKATRPGQTILVPGSGFMTPEYASPEQARLEPVSAKTDIWSWAVSVLEMIKGDLDWMYGQAAKFVLEDLYGDLASRDPVALILAECLKDNPKERPTNLLVIAHQIEKSFEAAASRLYSRKQGTAIELHSEDLSNRGASLIDIGNIEEGFECFKKSLELNPRCLYARYNSLVTLWRQGKTNVDLVMEELLQYDSQSTKEIQYQLARMLCKENGQDINTPLESLKKEDLLSQGCALLATISAGTLPLQHCIVKGRNSVMAIPTKGKPSTVYSASGEVNTITLPNEYTHAADIAPGLDTAIFIVGAHFPWAVTEQTLIIFDLKTLSIRHSTALTRIFTLVKIIASNHFLLMTADSKYELWSFDPYKCVTKGAFPSECESSGRVLTPHQIEPLPATSNMFINYGDYCTLCEPINEVWTKKLSLQPDSQPAYCICISNDGGLIASGGRSLHIWSISGEKFKDLATNRLIIKLQFSANSLYLLGAGEVQEQNTCAVLLWEVASGRILRTILLPKASGRIRSLYWDENNESVFVWCSNGQIWQWKITVPAKTQDLMIYRPVDIAERTQLEDNKRLRLKEVKRLIEICAPSKALNLVREFSKEEHAIKDPEVLLLERHIAGLGRAIQPHSIILQDELKPRLDRASFHVASKCNQILSLERCPKEWVGSKYVLYEISSGSIINSGALPETQNTVPQMDGVCFVMRTSRGGQVINTGGRSNYRSLPMSSVWSLDYNATLGRLFVMDDEWAELYNLLDFKLLNKWRHGDKYDRSLIGRFSADGKWAYVKYEKYNIRKINLLSTHIPPVFISLKHLAKEHDYIRFLEIVHVDGSLVAIMASTLCYISAQGAIIKQCAECKDVTALTVIPGTHYIIVGYVDGRIEIKSLDNPTNAIVEFRIGETVNSIVVSSDQFHVVVNGNFICRLHWDYLFS